MRIKDTQQKTTGSVSEDRVAGSLQSAERVLSIIEAVSKSNIPLSAVELSTSLGIQRTTVYGLINKAVSLGWIMKDPVSEKYVATAKMFELSRSFPLKQSIVKAALPHMREMAAQYKASVRLQYYNASLERVVLAEFREPSNITNGYIIPEISSVLHVTSSGKLYCAYMSGEELSKVLDGYKFTAYTPQSIPDRETFLKELEKVRRQGYAVDNGEFMVIHLGYSFPIFGENERIAGILTVNGVKNYMQGVSDNIISDSLVRTNLISRELGSLPS